MAECLVAGTRTPPWVRTTEPDDERWAQIRNGRTPPATSAVEKPGSAPRNAPLQAPVPVDLYSRGLWRDEVEAGNLYPVAVDVSSEITIERPVDVVSSFCVDPANVPDWYANIESVNWKTQPSLTTGSQIEFVARFLGRRLRYTYEVVEWVPGERFVMRTAEGPFPMETSYTWSPTGTSTTMRLRNHGEPSGFSKLVAPFMAPAIRRANRTDLRRLKLLLEAT